MTPKHVLAVDDDQTMRAMIADYLGDRGMRVTTVADGTGMERVLAAESVDLVILDLKLAGEDGLHLLRSLRARSTVPIIVITGHRREEIDRVVGLELGADDYLTKPFSLRELLARVHAVLRRFEASNAAEAPPRRRSPAAAGTLPLRRLGAGPAHPAAVGPARQHRSADQQRAQSAGGVLARAAAGAVARAAPGREPRA